MYWLLVIFNFHMNDESNNDTGHFLDLLKAGDLTQHVEGPTHVAGHTMDLMITRSADVFLNNIGIDIDPHSLNNYRSISNLPYLSKIIGRVVATKLSPHMFEYNLCEANQSAYKLNHSVETALVCVQNDILRAIDNQNIVIMLLLDLSAACDTVNHNVMLRTVT